MPQVPETVVATAPAPKTPSLIPGEQHPLPKTVPGKKAPADPAITAKIADGWRYVKIPEKDVYNYKFDGIAINSYHFGPGTHLLPPDIADEVESRLDIWRDSMLRLMNPHPDPNIQRFASGDRVDFNKGVEAE